MRLIPLCALIAAAVAVGSVCLISSSAEAHIAPAYTVKTAPTKSAKPVHIGAVNLKAPTAIFAAAPPLRKTWCGKVGKVFIPGTVLSQKGSNYRFISYAQLAKNYARIAKSLATPKRKKAALKRAAAFKKIASTKSPQSKACSTKKTPLRFKAAGALGLVERSSSASRQGRPKTRQSTSELLAIFPNGTIKDALVSGTISVSDWTTSPSNQLIVLLRTPADITNLTPRPGEPQDLCFLMLVDLGSGIPTCLEYLRGTGTGIGSGSDGVSTTKPIQFDATGGVYFNVTPCDAAGVCTGVFRRFKNGSVTTLVQGGLVGWVSPGGLIFADVGSPPTGMALQYYDANAVSHPLGLPSATKVSRDPWAFFGSFADGNIFMPGTDGGIARFLTADSTMDPNLWIGHGNGSHDWTAYCALPEAGSGPCQTAEISLKLHAQTGNGKDFFAVQNGLVQAFPTLTTITTDIKTPTRVTASGNHVLIAGANANGEFLLLGVDSTNTTVSTISSASTEGGQIEYYSLKTTSSGSVVFDGRRVATNEFIIGSIDPIGGKVTIINTSSSRPSHFLAF